jgi:hypothetical protein
MAKSETKSKRIGTLCAELKSQISDLDDLRLERKPVDDLHRGNVDDLRRGNVDEVSRKQALRSQVFRAIKKQLNDLSD